MSGRHLVGALIAPLLLLSACATEAEPDPGGSARTVRASPDALLDAGTVAFEVRWSASGDGQVLEHATIGHRDLDTGDLSMELRFGGVLAELAKRGEEGLPAGMDEPVRVIVAGGTTYLRAPMLDDLYQTSGWLAAAPGELAAGSRPSPPSGVLVDPTAVLEVLRGVRGVAVVGEEDVRGTSTTHLAATVDLVDALAHVPAARRTAVRAQLDQLDLRDAAIPVEVWIGADGLARRVVLDLSGLAGEGPAATMTIELFDHGRPVSIVAPPRSETTPYGEAVASVTETFLEAGA